MRKFGNDAANNIYKYISRGLTDNSIKPTQSWIRDFMRSTF